MINKEMVVSAAVLGLAIFVLVFLWDHFLGQGG